MTSPVRPERIDELLAHTGWARALARRLVADPSAADDLVQDAWVAALEGGYRHGDATKGWLARVMRNLATQRHRAEAARARREGSAARDEAIEEDEELLERAQLELRVANLVLELDEPSRQVLLLRYFERLDGARIAERLGVAHTTVRSRLARALEKLRERLDREDGGRERWTNAFVLAFARDARPTHTGSAAVAAGGMLVLAKVLAVVATCGVVGTGAWLALRTSDAPSVEAETKVAVVAEEQAPLVADVATPARAVDVLPTVEASTTTRHDDLAIVRGRFVDEDSTPIAGVSVLLRRRMTDAQAALDLPAGTLSDLPSTSGADGRFEIACVPMDGVQYELRHHGTGWARGAVRISRSEIGRKLERGRALELGDVVLERGGSVRVRVLDASGASLERGWRVDAWSKSSNGGASVSESAGDAERSPAARGVGGVWRFDDLPCGAWSLSASHACGRSAASAETIVEIGGESTVNLQYSGPDPERCIGVVLVERTYSVHDFDPATIMLSGRGASLSPTVDPAQGRRLFFTDLADDVYSLAVNDPRFEPFRADGLVPGASTVAALTGCSTIEWHVRTLPSAPELDRFAVSTSAHGTSMRVRRAGQSLGPGRTMDAPPGSYEWTVTTEDGAQASVSVRDLQPHERRVVDVVLSDDTRIEGRVVEADGVTPVRNALVGVFVTDADRVANGEVVRASGYVEMSARARIGKLLCETRCGADGRFSLERFAPGHVTLHVDAGAGRVVDRRGLVVRAGERGQELVLPLPESARFSGRVLAPQGARVDLVRVELRPKAVEDDSDWRYSDPWATVSRAEVSSDGAFCFERVGTGRFDVELVPDSNEVDRRVSMWAWIAADVVVSLGEIELAPGADARREFDLRERFPGALDVSVRNAGRPYAGARVFVGRRSDRIEDGPRAIADGDGRVRFEALPAGDWNLYVRGENDRWTISSPEATRVPPGGTASCVVDLELVRATLRVVDAATERPVAGEQILFITDDADGGSRGKGVTLDASGEVRLEVPVGRWRVDWPYGLHDPDRRRGEFEWTRSGPVPAVVRLGPKPQPPKPTRR